MSNYASKYYGNYDGGLNDSASAREIARHEASVLRNWDITYHGSLRRRDGLTQKGNTIHASNPILGLGSYLRSTGAKDLLTIVDTTLYYLNSSTYTALDDGFTGSLLYWMETVISSDKVYIGNEDNQTHMWDRGATTFNGCLTDLGAGVPHGNVYRYHKNHMFTINNVNVSGTKYPNRIYWSAIGDSETWDTTNDFFEVPGDGRAMTIMDLGANLVIFKERAIQFLDGWGDDSWRITASSSNVSNIDERVGICGPRACTRVGNEIWFMDDEGLIRRLYQTDFDAYRRDIISTKIKGTLAGLNKSQISKTIAWTSNDKVYFSVPNGTSTSNNLVLVYDITTARRTGEEAWTTYTGWAPNLFADYITTSTPELYLGGNSAGKIWIHTGTDDDGVAIDARYDGKDDPCDYPDLNKRMAYGRIRGNTTSNASNVGIYASVDQGPYAYLGDLTLQATGEGLGPTGTFRLGPTGTSRFSGNSALAELQYFFSSGGGRIGGRSTRMSIRHNATGSQPVVNEFTNYFKTYKPR